MAFHKLPLSLYSAKAGITHSDASTQYLHFVASFRQDRNRYVFVCEAQPVLTLRSHGLPKRCPLCRQDDPIGTEIQAEETI
jgi:hypothetical protein